LPFITIILHISKVTLFKNHLEKAS